MVGRARGLMESSDPGYQVNRCREGLIAQFVPGQAGLLLPEPFNLAPGPATLPMTFKR